ncbi:hypothetical protein L207DRAFT_580691 [Hyaloscypha variabilis F]|uniref:Uncharacterized protein n=1 Tax=Hyaloscypha variabilis (strain UAMH 11265 / GT02V1 / F) TaxID=1149755 RepID=A0A2J6RU22_HYAVF|nr:hypothetical protein L207DRAFT_580691 [Hyaloscypha variabilis F]
MSSVNRQFSNTLPRFSTNEEIVLLLYGSDHSLRGAFLHQFQDSRFLEAILEDNSALLWAILKANFGAWLYSVGWWDNFSRLTRQDDKFIGDNQFLWHLMDQHVLRLQNLAMLKHSLKVLQYGGCNMLRAQQGTQAHKAMTGLTIDYEELVKRTEDQIVGIQHRLSTLAAIRSITESEKSIKQSEKIGSLTTLATFFIPLSFVSSLLGMNVMEISSQKTSIWVFFVISIPLTLLAFIVLANWESLKDALMYLFAKRCYSASGTCARNISFSANMMMDTDHCAGMMAALSDLMLTPLLGRTAAAIFRDANPHQASAFPQTGGFAAKRGRELDECACGSSLRPVGRRALRPAISYQRMGLRSVDDAQSCEGDGCFSCKDEVQESGELHNANIERQANSLKYF